ncbi:hypothetical protein BCR41DRAFT_108041 [Lobosporangium transversale]|uniref:Uncharacterized protein n=1 Tax=Lobosporangium transversale TaxID=64571 RepID=A0A1Y2GJR5_9FUNG|nr:hypothetical protein BCR41DRAFT_115084 [Lobosporangium transversale]XP_021879805.1 hypothetical protein BCR41DRAFT_108041 [Lobosporangium transversale]ORZ10987.1 hypothetical protein BCR41DRAFT_115084 [Lobosporangium transversale]ORZ11708.1 hypothetical protein BCR41DRAFT_108041 [Lobosporangium transversale]|eukprot:XP_021879504.1 hypothetical protein BCR41DRAFT_115084 [Lobosporangium transversale]
MATLALFIHLPGHLCMLLHLPLPLPLPPHFTAHKKVNNNNAHTPVKQVPSPEPTAIARAPSPVPKNGSYSGSPASIRANSCRPFAPSDKTTSTQTIPLSASIRTTATTATAATATAPSPKLCTAQVILTIRTTIF